MKNLVSRALMGKVSNFAKGLFVLAILASSVFSCKHDSKTDEKKKLSDEELSISKITVGDETKEGIEIVDGLVLMAPHDMQEATLSIEANPKDVKVTYEPELIEGKLPLSAKETSLKITLTKNEKHKAYNFKIRKRVLPSNLIDGIAITGARKDAKQYIVDQENVRKILAGETDVVLECLGPFAKIKAVAKKRVWHHFEVDETKIKINPWSDYQYASFALADITLSNRDEKREVKIKVRDGEDEAVLNFKIKRLDEIADMPCYKLLILGENVITKKDVLTWLSNGTNPKFYGSEPTAIEVCTSYNAMKTVTIDGKPCTIGVRKDEKGKDEWYAKLEVEGIQSAGSEGKEVTLSILPINENDYTPINWSFKIVYKEAIPMTVNYEINGKGEADLEPSFLQGIENNGNPLIDVSSKYLNLKLASNTEVANIKINDKTIAGNELIKEDGNYVLFYSMELGTETKEIDIKITPLYEAAFIGKSFKFRAKGNGSVEKIEPELYEISGDKNFSKENFLDKLIDGSKPLYETYKTEANIFIKLLAYHKDFLCKEVKVNGEVIELQREAGLFGLPDVYNVKTNISVTNEPVDVIIEFIASRQASSVKWEFKVKGGGKKPSIPEKRIKRFVINGAGAIGSNPLPESLTKHLTDGSNPLYQFDGKKAVVEVGCNDSTLIDKIEFMMDGVLQETKKPVKNGYVYYATHTFNMEDLSTHPIKLIIHPQNKEDYSPLVFAFQLQSTGKKIALKPVFFELNEVKMNNGAKVSLQAETAILSVYAEKNIIKKAKIGEKASDEMEVDVEEVTLVTGKKIWKAKREVSLLNATGDSGATKTFVIRALPIDVGEYDEAVYEYTITGVKFQANNAEFSYRNGKPEITNQLDWMANCNSRFPDDYGVKAIKELTAYTASPRARVKCQIVGPNDEKIEGKAEVLLDSNNEKHTTKNIAIFEDKPTTLKIWVVAEDGSTNDEKGLWRFTYNKVDLRWDWQEKTKGEEFENKAYDVIELERSAIENATDKKIYLSFGASAKHLGYTLDTEGLPNTQTAFVELNKVKAIQYYKTSVDLSPLIANSSTVDKIEVVFKMKKRNKYPCLNHKVIIKLKD